MVSITVEKIKSSDVVSYTLMPRFVPRIRQVFFSGFGYLTFLLAQIYASVRLLPKDHPYLNSANIGRYGIRHVITEASKNLVFKRENIDQILIFFAIITGIVLMIAQFLLLIYALLGANAYAFSWFDTPDPTDDIAFNILDRVFGVPGVFCSSFTAICTSYSIDTNGPLVAGAPPIPLPFHDALHELYRFYSWGMLLIGTLIFLYFIVVIVLETAVTGSPFGNRFQNVWVPIRLIVAVSLLLPIGFGLNSGQYIVLYAAKYGSSFATTGWTVFNNTIATHTLFSTINGNPIGESGLTMLAMPEAPDISGLIEAMSIVHACAYAYTNKFHNLDHPDPGVAGQPDISDDYASAATRIIRPYMVKNPSSSMTAGSLNLQNLTGAAPVTGNPANRVELTTGTTYLDALGFFYGTDIVIRFGQRYTEGTDEKFKDDTGNVEPTCGEIRIPVSDLKDVGGAMAGRGGPDFMLKFYFDMLKGMWFTSGVGHANEFKRFARSFVTKEDGNRAKLAIICNGTLSGCGTAPYYRACGPAGPPPLLQDTCFEAQPLTTWKSHMVSVYLADVQSGIRQAWADYVTSSVVLNANGMTPDILARGWGGAGIWYNKIAEINGGFMNGVLNIPVMDLYPKIMEDIRKERRKSNREIDGEKQFEPTIVQGKEGVDMKIDSASLTQIGVPLHKVYAYFQPVKGSGVDNSTEDMQNTFMRTFHMFFGTTGLSRIRTTNAQLHPLAQLVAVGKGLIESAIRNIATSSASAFLGGLVGTMGGKDAKLISGFSEVVSQITLSVAFIGLSAGFVLYYVLPFLPFVYFYFAVASWVKAIFEAMVGVPLWALAHLRIDGDGLPGDAAANGYFLILEIFIRPILTVVGLLAAIVIFSTQVRILNYIWDLVVSNAAGFVNNADITGRTDPAVAGNRGADDFQRSIVDQFFFTIIYTVICYMMALASFKLIDKIPDNILRWAGAGVSSFGDIDADHVEGLTRYAVTGSMIFGEQGSQAIVGTAKGAGSSLGALIKGNDPAPPAAKV